MKNNNKIDIKKPEQLVEIYNNVIKVIDTDATNQDERSYGGMIRMAKGKLVEYLAEQIVLNAWKNIGGKLSDIAINANKIKIKINEEYINKIKDPNVKKYILENLENYVYGCSVDKHVFINGKFVFGIECKAYTENAMLKRILVDFHLLKTVNPNIKCFLFQLESQLTGDYSQIENKITYGSYSTHTLMSYFNDVDLNIITLLNGERDIEKPIHKFFKQLDLKIIYKIIRLFENLLRNFLE